MKDGVIATLLVVAMVAGAGVGYLISSRGTAMNTTTTTITASCPSATTEEYTPSGFRVGVTYQGPWNATVSTFSTPATTPGYLLSSCRYGGIGTAYVYVPSLDLNGLQTVVGTAHKLDSGNGTLTVTVTYGGLSRYNSTTLPFGSATIQLNEYQAKGTTSYGG
jgi:hypothetical protein